MSPQFREEIGFPDQLDEIHNAILRMGSMVEDSLNRALSALITRDHGAARAVVAGDEAIDRLQLVIEEMCTTIIATSQPVAADLRQVLVAIKIASDLERIGDHARHLARVVERAGDPILSRTIPTIELMATKGIAMVHDSLTAYVEQDIEAAKLIARRDDEIDALHTQLYRQIIGLMRERPDNIEQGTTMIFLNRFLERLGDHVTNMCEWIVYAQTGRRDELNKT